MRQWEEDNQENFQMAEVSEYGDLALGGRLINKLSLPQSTMAATMEHLGPTEISSTETAHQDGQRAFTGEDFELGGDSQQPGDLVELR